MSGKCMCDPRCQVPASKAAFVSGSTVFVAPHYYAAMVARFEGLAALVRTGAEAQTERKVPIDALRHPWRDVTRSDWARGADPERAQREAQEARTRDNH